MTTNKRTASLSIDDDIETKKHKTENDLTASTTNKESIPTFIDENITNKKICEYGETCYRQKNPMHTAQYHHPRKSF
jgi:hypothetical protein